MMGRLALVAISVGVASISWAAESGPFPEADALPAIAELPDPFLLRNGGRVETPDDWALQRQQLKDLIQEYEYGHLPPYPDHVTVMRLKKESLMRSSTVTIKIVAGGNQAEFPLLVTLPKGRGPNPAIITSTLRRPEIRELILERGYALVEIDLADIAADGPDRKGAFYTLYPETDAGVLVAWAWGFQRAVDGLASVKYIDFAKAIVTGHSRVGKAALVAGAFDERIALTAPNGSGLAGTGNFRILHGKCEKIENITGFAPYWFTPRLREFVGQPERLPFDQHSVMALVAPRALLITSGTEDAWCNPRGTQTSYEAAKLVYDFLGAQEKIGIHYRPGGHDQNAEDWTALLDFADQQFEGKEVATRFDMMPYLADPAAMPWATVK